MSVIKIVTGILIIVVLLLAILWLTVERSLFPRRSTVHFWRLSALPVRKKIEGYIYGARSSWYLKPATWPWLIKRFKDRETAHTYHGKMLTREDAIKLITLNQPIEMADLDQVIPYPVARDIILRNPLPSMAAMECPCRAQKADACEPRQVCLVMGEPFVSFALEHQPDITRRITAEEALEILDGEEKRGHIHTAWFKDVMHNRFYAICNCCSCCCLGMKSYQRGVPRLAHSGYSPVFYKELCTQCGICIEMCPFDAIKSEDDLPGWELSACMGCGLCASHCPGRAIELQLDSSRGVPLDIHMLIQETC